MKSKTLGTLEYAYMVDRDNILRVFVGQLCVSRMEVDKGIWKTYDGRGYFTGIEVDQIVKMELINLGYIDKHSTKYYSQLEDNNEV